MRTETCVEIYTIKKEVCIKSINFQKKNDPKQ